MKGTQMKMTQLIGSLALAIWLSPAVAEDYSQTTRVKLGDAAPDFSCQTLAGSEFALSKEKGKVVLINFFATWCGPCMAEMPHLDKEISQKFGSRTDFKLVAIGREHSAAELAKFVKEKNFSLPIAPDPKRDIYGKYATQYIPRNFVIGKDGKIKFSSVGYSEKDFQELIEVIQKEVAK
jgi:peroxiredoxin